jgi:hypothetical protein
VTFLNVASLASSSNLSDARSRTSALLQVVQGVSLRLDQVSGRCRLGYGNPDVKWISLDILWPCEFHVGLDGQLRTKSRKGKILLVQHATSNPELPGDCDTQVQAIRVDSNRVEASKSASRVAACPPFQWDDAMFFGLFEK